MSVHNFDFDSTIGRAAMVIRVITHSGAQGVNSFGSTAPGLDKLSVIGSVDLGLVIYVRSVSNLLS